MGILNVTPDSFSDGGTYYTVSLAVDRAKKMEDAGVDLIDIGGESTRPYSQAIDQEEELSRVVPVLEKLQGKVSAPISIDTTKAKVALAALDLGAEIVNDVSGLEADDGMIDVVLKTGAAVCAMHRQGTPQTMQNDPKYAHCVVEILQYLMDRDRFLIGAGIAPEKICLDPGIGFGKTHEHNLELIRSIGVFHQLQRPILVGHSRKGFIGKLLKNKDQPRDFGTLGVSFALHQQGIQVLRVHDVEGHVQAFRMLDALGM